MNIFKDILHYLKPQIKDVFDSFYPFYILYQVLGVEIFEIETVNGRRVSKLSISRITRYVLQLSIISWYELSDMDYDFADLDFSDYVNTANDIYTAVLYALVAVLCLVFSKKYVYILNSIVAIDNDFRQMGLDVYQW